jgi:MFS family permease
VFFFLTFFMQQNLRFSPISTGLAFLPMTAVLVVTSTVAQTRILPRTGAKPLVVTGMALGAIAMLLFTRLSTTSTYAANVLPGLLIIGVGLGCIFAPAIGTATLGVEVAETGVASAVVNTCQQIGGSVGLALLSTVSASAAANYAQGHATLPDVAAAAAVHGYTTSFLWAAAIFLLGFLLALLILPAKARPRVCTVRAALARGLAYAHHTEPADASASPTP